MLERLLDQHGITSEHFDAPSHRRRRFCGPTRLHRLLSEPLILVEEMAVNDRVQALPVLEQKTMEA